MMSAETCALCKEPVDPDIAIPLMIGKRRVYHPDCYQELDRRLREFWSLLTGPVEEFEAWLRTK